MRITFKEVAKAAFVNGIGRMPNLAAWVDKLSCWTRFSRWCIERGGDEGGYLAVPHYSHDDRYGLYERVIVQEHLDVESVDYLEFGMYRGESIAWWGRRITHPHARFIGFDTFTGLPKSGIKVRLQEPLALRGTSGC